MQKALPLLWEELWGTHLPQRPVERSLRQVSGRRGAGRSLRNQLTLSIQHTAWRIVGAQEITERRTKQLRCVQVACTQTSRLTCMCFSGHTLITPPACAVHMDMPNLPAHTDSPCAGARSSRHPHARGGCLPHKAHLF